MSCYGMQGRTSCPPSVFPASCVLSTQPIVNSHSKRPADGTLQGCSQQKGNDISSGHFSGSFQGHGSGVLLDNQKLSVLFISTSPHCLVILLLHTQPRATAIPIPPGLFVFSTAIFCWLWILFFRKSSEGKFVQFVSTKVCLRELALIFSSLEVRKCLAGRKSYC